MSVFSLCEQAIGLVRGKRLILSSEEKQRLEALDYDGLTALYAQDEAVVCALHFERVRDRLLELYPFVFARKVSQLKAGEKLPNDCLTVLCVLVDGKAVEYEEDMNRKLNLSENSEVHYTSKIAAVNLWDGIFTDIFVYSLAIEIAPSITGNAQASQILEQKVQELIHRAYQIGAIKAETFLTLKEELYKRAITLSRGNRTISPVNQVSQEQGIDNTGYTNWRKEAEYYACVRSGDSVRDRLFEIYAWKFARTSVNLSSNTTGISGWKYAYTLPNNCMKVLSVVSNDEVQEYEANGKNLYCNEKTASVRYTARIEDEASWSGAFKDVYVYQLAIEVVYATTGKADVIQLLEEKSRLLIQDALQTGAIEEDTNIPPSEEIYGRAIALSHGAEEKEENLTIRNSRELRVCKRSAPYVRDRLLQLYPFVFARKTAVYTNSLPSDCLTVLAVIVNDKPVSIDEIKSGAKIIYTSKQDNFSTWDAVFKDAFCYMLAAEIVRAVKGNIIDAQNLEQQAQEYINHGYQIGAIKAETQIPLKDELFNRAIGLAHGDRTFKETSNTAQTQGIDSYGKINQRNIAEIRACESASENVRDRLLGLYPWRFARKSTTLTSASSTIDGWNYGYVLPSDCMNVLCLLSNNDAIDYEVNANNIYCNEANPTIRYTAKITEMSSWSGIFKDIYCYSLAQEIVSATTGNLELIQLLEQKIQTLIQESYKLGEIKTETRIPVKLELFNRAIGLVKGLKTKNPEILDNRYEDEISACRRSYENLRDKLLEGYAWIFARKTETPARLSESVPGWKYTYILPEDCMKVNSVIAQDKRRNNPYDYECCNVSEYPENIELMEYETAGHELYANRDVVYVRYTAKITDTNKWAALFTEALVILMAIEVALNVVGDKNIIAILEQRLAKVLEEAQATRIIQEETRLPRQRESIRTGALNRQYKDYSGIPTFACGYEGNYYGGRLCDGNRSSEFCGW